MPNWKCHHIFYHLAPQTMLVSLFYLLFLLVQLVSSSKVFISKVLLALPRCVCPMLSAPTLRFFMLLCKTSLQIKVSFVHTAMPSFKLEPPVIPPVQTVCNVSLMSKVEEQLHSLTLQETSITCYRLLGSTPSSLMSNPMYAKIK